MTAMAGLNAEAFIWRNGGFRWPSSSSTGPSVRTRSAFESYADVSADTFRALGPTLTMSDVVVFLPNGGNFLFGRRRWHEPSSGR